MGWIQERGSKQQTHKVTIEPRFFFNMKGFICSLNWMLLSVWFYMAGVRNNFIVQYSIARTWSALKSHVLKLIQCYPQKVQRHQVHSRIVVYTSKPWNPPQSSYTRAAEELKPLAVHANWSLDVLGFPPACCCKGHKALAWSECFTRFLPGDPWNRRRLRVDFA